jgi:hypothetical protein
MSKQLIIKEIVDFDMSFCLISVFTITPCNIWLQGVRNKKGGNNNEEMIEKIGIFHLPVDTFVFLMPLGMTC